MATLFIFIPSGDAGAWGFRRERQVEGLAAGIRPAAKELLGSVLDGFAGIFHILAKAVGRTAADDHRQEGRAQHQKNEALHEHDGIHFHRVIVKLAAK
jgi:hypothetical protein